MKQQSLTRQAVSATLHCLTGCAVGEILGMVIATALGLPDVPSIALAVGLAFVFGYGLTMRPVLAAGLPLRRAFAVALAADTVSIAVMEIVDNGFMMAVPGALHAGLADVLFWAPLLGGFVIAFVVTVPVNRALIARGRGHAVVHAYHHGHADHGTADHGHADHGHADHGHADHGHADHGHHA
ncbi:DUF4396 domain-containing protein [Actinocorallia longicatena]|uniref:DUF4396 domain-containing protein n=1 Tax=Actinocorallia longicatena TaxID=111803 RepID=A0ABP6Q8A6_9ACTN